MRSSNESYLLSALKGAAALFMALPFSVGRWTGRTIGFFGYFFLTKKRRVSYVNLKTIFRGAKSPRELRRLVHDNFVNFFQSCVEILCLPKIKEIGFERLVDVRGREYVEQAMAKGKGLILLAVHEGNWELASVVGSSMGYPYNIVANEQPKMPQLDRLLNEYRATAGAKVIAPGAATRDIIRALQKNEIVTLVLDQGGKDGSPVKFFGKTASMSTGAIRIALKYGIPICPVWPSRLTPGQSRLEFFPALDLTVDKDTDKGMMDVARRATAHFEKLLANHPQEYMWFYKVFKYTTEPHVLILDDGRTGHLRQSQAAAQVLSQALEAKGKTAVVRTIQIHFKSRFLSKVFKIYAGLAQFLPFLKREDALSLFLTTDVYDALRAEKADYVISCGSTVGGLNFLVSHWDMAKSICLLKSGLVFWDRFDQVIVPSHDEPSAGLRTRLAVTKVALNLITPSYLNEQKGLLLNHYAHLKNNVRTKIGVLLGGDTKGVVFDEAQIRSLIRQLKEAALHFNADILVTTSRRTSPVIDVLISREFKNFERCPLCIIANESNIPSAVGGILGLSDLVIVSGESISMVSEAVCAGKKTIVFCPTGQYSPNPASKYDHFVLGLSEQGFLLASSIKDISIAITDMLRNKILLKTLDDRAVVRKAIEGII